MGKWPELGVHCPCLLGEGRGATRESCAPRLEGPHSTERLCISVGPLKSLLMDPANVLWRPVLCHRCGSNHTDDWPLTGREILSELAGPTYPCVREVERAVCTLGRARQLNILLSVLTP